MTLPANVGALKTPRLGHQAWRVDKAPVSIGARMTRFRDPAFASVPVPPFPGYVRQPVRKGGGSRACDRPRFSFEGGRAIVRIDIDAGTALFGTGEQAGTLVRNGTRKVCWNTDIPDYSDHSPSLYQSHPWVLALRADGTAFGVICETTWRCTIDLRGHIQFEVEGPSPAVLVIERDSAREVLQALGEITGKPPLPPLWALGFHQCRYSYFPEARVREVAGEFRRRKIPCDVIWMDIDYMEGYRCFTFSEERFPDPRKLTKDLHGQGFRVVAMIDPGLKVDGKYGVYAEGRKGNHFVKGASGKEYHGNVWPGACAFPDFTRAGTREWWAGLYGPFMANGIDGVWNDMNEPAVFGGHGPGKTMPGDNAHDADLDLGGPGPHDRYHNVYGMQMIRATRDGIARVQPDRRPFVLTRANFLGGQRYGATWTGDNRSDWRHLTWSIPMVLNLGLSGQAFVGPDIGGFIGDADAGLFARWMGIGAMLPFARAHTDTNSGPHEPWSFGKACAETCRRAIERRYALIPYLYTVFEEASRTGLPVARPLWFADPTNAELRGVENAFLLGDDVLVWCDVRQGRGAEAAIPLEGWQEFEPVEGQRRADRDLPRLYLRPGAAIAVASPATHTGAMDLSSLRVLANLDADSRACGGLYSDAGDGFDHERGEFSRTRINVEANGGTPRVSVKLSEGVQRFVPKLRLEVLRAARQSRRS